MSRLSDEMICNRQPSLEEIAYFKKLNEWICEQQEEEIEILNQLLIEDSYEASSITTSIGNCDAPVRVHNNIQQSHNQSL